MIYSTTDLSFNLLVKEFSELAKIFGEVTGKMVDCFMHPIRLALLS